jgi:hypothetical protein
MAIDPDRLERQRRDLERLELDATTKRVKADAAGIGLIRLCETPDCGRVIAKHNLSGLCKRCKNRRWMARHRSKLRVVGGEAA